MCEKGIVQNDWDGWILLEYGKSGFEFAIRNDNFRLSKIASLIEFVSKIGSLFTCLFLSQIFFVVVFLLGRSCHRVSSTSIVDMLPGHNYCGAASV